MTTLGGTAVLFEAGIPRDIADEIGLLAIQMGAKEYNIKNVKEVEAEVAEFEEVIDTAIDEVFEVKTMDTNLVTTLEKMMDEGDPKNFKSDGYPKAAVVNKAMGETIDSDAREAAWESILNS